MRGALSHQPAATSGPHTQAFTPLDEDSDSDSDSDDENGAGQAGAGAEDVNSLLVRSWEAKVFPIIRRRFRNETERRDGLEQIRGALALGMADIARQTVEFLYEEQGGLPRDLNLPTLDDVREELQRFSIDRLRRGQPVVVVCRGEGDVLPGYCTPTMAATLGLAGEVLEVDTAHELVQVETYLRSEGVLVRFWYPLSALEKPPDSARKTAITGAQVVNVHSVTVHRELLSWEFACARLNCRESYVLLLEHSRDPALPSYCCVEENSPQATMIRSSILLFRDIDMENYQYISDQQLAGSDSGNLLETNLAITQSGRALQLQDWRPSALFYRDCELLRAELRDAVVVAGSQGEDYLIELASQVCLALQLAPELFTTEEVPINDSSSLKSSIQFPGAAFVCASVRLGPEVKEWSELGELTIQLQTPDGAAVRSNGQLSGRDIIQGPSLNIDNSHG